MGLWGSLVALEVWDLSTPVQIRAAPFNIQRKCHQNQKKQNQQEDSELDTDVPSELNWLMLNKNKDKNRNVLIVTSLESREFQKEFGNVQNAEKNLHQIYTI